MTNKRPINELYDLFKAMNATIVFSKKSDEDPKLVIKRPRILNHQDKLDGLKQD